MQVNFGQLVHCESVMSLLVDFLAVMCLIFQTTGETATVCFSRTCSLAWGLSEVDHQNATEFCKLLLYTSPVVLYGVSSQNVYQHFIPLFTAVTLLVSPIFFICAYLLSYTLQPYLLFASSYLHSRVTVGSLLQNWLDVYSSTFNYLCYFQHLDQALYSIRQLSKMVKINNRRNYQTKHISTAGDHQVATKPDLTKNRATSLGCHLLPG